MATAYRSSQSVTNGTAGTTVVVSKPAGIVDTGTNPSRDQLIAYIAAAGAPTITPPAGWTLITSVASGSNVTLWCYRKLASSEGASWTWTLGSSLRNWGWVGAYTGVDPATPVVATGTDNTLDTSTTLQPTLASLLQDGQGVGAAAAVRAATGTATTWTTTSTERADLSTNAGAGTDIAGVIGDSQNGTGSDAQYGPVLTASQTQSAGVALSVTLTPYFTPYSGGALSVVVEAAFGANPDGDLTAATWTQLVDSAGSPLVLQDPGVFIKAGRPNGTSTADPTMISFTAKNINGEFTKPGGLYTTSMVLNLPIRVRISGIGARTYTRATAFLASMKPRWDKSLKVSVVDIVAQGRTRRYQRNTQPLRSAAYRSLRGTNANSSLKAVAYWALEDDSTATSGASAFSGHPSAIASDISFGSSNLYPGSASIAVHSSATSSMSANIPTYATSTSWAIGFALSLPSEPAATTPLIQVHSTGTAPTWRLSLVPGAPSALQLDVFDNAGASLLSVNFALTEADYFGKAIVHTLTATQSGADINYDFEVSNGLSTAGSSGHVGTLAGRTAGQLTAWQTIASTGMSGASFGHFVVYSDTSSAIALSNLAITMQSAVSLGNAGEWPWARFQRLCIEEGVPYDLTQSTNTDLTMGPQPIATFLSLVDECRVIEGCLVHDAGSILTPGGLVFPARESRDNASTVLTLDFALKQVTDGFEPALDDLNVVDDVEVRRAIGSSARVTASSSSGQYPTQITVNTFDDTFLRDLAGFAVNVGTVPGMRFPAVGWNFRRSPELAQAWLQMVPLSARLDITHPPSQYPPDVIETFIEGYAEVISSYAWNVQANVSPAAGNRIFVLAATSGDTGTFLGRLVWDTCLVHQATVTSGATSFTVDTTPLMTTVADDFPFDIVNTTGERMTITNCAGASNPQTLTATRAVNGVASTMVAGNALTLQADYTTVLGL